MECTGIAAEEHLCTAYYPSCFFSNSCFECGHSRMEIINWGLISCANIANKNVHAIELSRNSNLVAIASRSIDKAIAFAAENDLFKTVRLYSSYQDLLDDSNVHAVYLPLPTTLHLEWAIKAANAKKHILIEKPAALDSTELMLILQACRLNNVIFMDGVMFMHHDRTNLLRRCLRDPFAGEVRFFSFLLIKHFTARCAIVKCVQLISKKGIPQIIKLILFHYIKSNLLNMDCRSREFKVPSHSTVLHKNFWEATFALVLLEILWVPWGILVSAE